MDDQQKLMNWILKTTVTVLAAVIAVVVIVLCIGLFMPNEQIDNTKIFEMINPAFNTIIGAFVGLLGGLSINKGEKKEEPKKEEPPPAPAAAEAPKAAEEDHQPDPIPHEEENHDHHDHIA